MSWPVCSAWHLGWDNIGWPTSLLGCHLFSVSVSFQVAFLGCLEGWQGTFKAGITEQDRAKFRSPADGPNLLAM